jgi:hypothetical protein
MKSHQPGFYLDLSGTPTEMGHAHGETLRPVIQDTVGRWQAELADAAKMPFPQLLSLFHTATDYRSAIECWTPHLLEEVHAIAAGAAMDPDLIYAWQLIDEILDFLVEHMQAEKCTTLGGYGQDDGVAPVLGKTNDLPHCYIGSHALIRTRYANSDIDILNTVVAGTVGSDGMSPYLGSCCNHVGQLERHPGGLPVPYLVRLMLERCRSVEEGHQLLASLDHASGMNYALIDRNTVRTYEASANHVEEFQPAPDLKRIWHTNHPLSNTNYCRDISLWNGLPDAEAGNTEARYAFVERELRYPGKALTVERARELLSSREVPVSSHAEDSFPTIFSLIIEFTEQPRLLFSPGPPSQHDYLEFGFD